MTTINKLTPEKVEQTLQPQAVNKASCAYTQDSDASSLSSSAPSSGYFSSLVEWISGLLSSFWQWLTSCCSTTSSSGATTLLPAAPPTSNLSSNAPPVSSSSTSAITLPPAATPVLNLSSNALPVSSSSSGATTPPPAATPVLNLPSNTSPASSASQIRPEPSVLLSSFKTQVVNCTRRLVQGCFEGGEYTGYYALEKNKPYVGILQYENVDSNAVCCHLFDATSLDAVLEKIAQSTPASNFKIRISFIQKPGTNGFYARYESLGIIFHGLAIKISPFEDTVKRLPADQQVEARAKIAALGNNPPQNLNTQAVDKARNLFEGCFEGGEHARHSAIQKARPYVGVLCFEAGSTNCYLFDDDTSFNVVLEKIAKLPPHPNFLATIYFAQQPNTLSGFSASCENSPTGANFGVLWTGMSPFENVVKKLPENEQPAARAKLKALNRPSTDLNKPVNSNSAATFKEQLVSATHKLFHGCFEGGEFAADCALQKDKPYVGILNYDNSEDKIGSTEDPVDKYYLFYDKTSLDAALEKLAKEPPLSIFSIYLNFIQKPNIQYGLQAYCDITPSEEPVFQKLEEKVTWFSNLTDELPKSQQDLADAKIAAL